MITAQERNRVKEWWANMTDDQRYELLLQLNQKIPVADQTAYNLRFNRLLQATQDAIIDYYNRLKEW